MKCEACGYEDNRCECIACGHIQDAPSSCTSGLLCSVWIPTDYETGKIDKLADPVFSDGDIDFEPKLSAGWVWREYKLMPVTPNTDVCGERSESVERSG